MLTRQQIDAAAENLQGIVRHTELIHSPYHSKLIGTPLYFKCENLQHTGSFKLRGAYNYLSARPQELLDTGIVTASAGNHALGLASAATLLNCPCRVVIPEGTLLAKELSLLNHGATVDIVGNNLCEAEAYAKQYAKDTGLLYIPASDHQLIMAGQGTIGLEILQDLPDLNTLLVPIGGGGLISGIATAIKSEKPNVRIIGVEAACMASASLARRKGHPKQLSTRSQTFAEEIAVKKIGEEAFLHIEKYVDDIVTVEEKEIARAIVSLMEKGKMIIEGAAAVSLAAALYGVKTRLKGKTLCLLSGGNLDLQCLPRVVERGLLAEGHYLKLSLAMIDMPGALAHLTLILSELKANIFQISHDRNKFSLPLGEAEVLLDLETRGTEHIRDILTRLENEGYQPEVVR